MRFQFVAALCAALAQGVHITESPELAQPYSVAELEAIADTHTLAELEAEADAALEAFVDAVLQNEIDSGALVLSEGQADAEGIGAQPKVLEQLKGLKDKIMAKIKKLPKPTMGGVMTVIADVAGTAMKAGAMIAAPNPITIGLFAKQIWDDYQHAKQAVAWTKANMKK